MPCYQSTNLPGGVTTTGRTSYTTEADCLNACKDGACCEGTLCSVKPQCQCQGTGKTFKGVGTVCTPNPCVKNCSQCPPGKYIPKFVTLSYTATFPGFLFESLGCGTMLQRGVLIEDDTSFSGEITLQYSSLQGPFCGYYSVDLGCSAAASLGATRITAGATVPTISGGTGAINFQKSGSIVGGPITSPSVPYSYYKHITGTSCSADCQIPFSCTFNLFANSPAGPAPLAFMNTDGEACFGSGTSPLVATANWYASGLVVGSVTVTGAYGAA